MYIKRRGASLTLSIALQLGEAVIRTASTVDVDTGELQVEESAVFVKGEGEQEGIWCREYSGCGMESCIPPPPWPLLCPVLAVIPILRLRRPCGEMDLYVPKLVSIRELDCPGRRPTPWECTITSV
jgi:hypothetical protein